MKLLYQRFMNVEQHSRWKEYWLEHRDNYIVVVLVLAFFYFLIAQVTGSWNPITITTTLWWFAVDFVTPIAIYFTAFYGLALAFIFAVALLRVIVTIIKFLWR